MLIRETENVMVRAGAEIHRTSCIHRTSGDVPSGPVHDNLASHVDRSVAGKANCAVSIQKGEFINLEIKVIRREIIAGTCGRHGIRFKENGILGILNPIRQQEPYRAYIWLRYRGAFLPDKYFLRKRIFALLGIRS
jgi:hypothetical protein